MWFYSSKTLLMYWLWHIPCLGTVHNVSSLIICNLLLYYKQGCVGVKYFDQVFTERKAYLCCRLHVILTFPILLHTFLFECFCNHFMFQTNGCTSRWACLMSGQSIYCFFGNLTMTYHIFVAILKTLVGSWCHQWWYFSSSVCCCSCVSLPSYLLIIFGILILCGSIW